MQDFVGLISLMKVYNSSRAKYCTFQDGDFEKGYIQIFALGKCDSKLADFCNLKQNGSKYVIIIEKMNIFN